MVVRVYPDPARGRGSPRERPLNHRLPARRRARTVRRMNDAPTTPPLATDSEADGLGPARHGQLGRDLRGAAKLGVNAVLGMTDVVEAMHRTIGSLAAPLGRSPTGPTRGITGFVYRSIRGTTRGVGATLDTVLRLWPDAPANGPAPRRDAVVSALNGVWGDRLASEHNPLAIPMTLRRDGRPVTLDETLGHQLPQATGKLLVLVHGLCMNDLQWQRDGHDHGAMLAAAGGHTVLYLHYNSGRHVSVNGREFAAQLERLVAHWPVPVEQVALLGHSMGGLVIRSACHQARQQRLHWPAHLSHLVCLGTPHHGAPLERGGRRLDQLLGLSPYLRPLGRIGEARSAGITDLRHGNLQDADWQGHAPGGPTDDRRVPTPLPRGVACHLVAATQAAQADGPGRLRDRLLGDGLVPLASALGDHPDRRLALKVPARRRLVVPECNHWGLLNHPAVAEQLKAWLTG